VQVHLHRLQAEHHGGRVLVEAAAVVGKHNDIVTRLALCSVGGAPLVHCNVDSVQEIFQEGNSLFVAVSGGLLS
jgi:hypothetical protein